MRLLIDQGNTRLKWALVDDRQEIVRRGVSADAMLPDQLRDELHAACPVACLSVVVSSVAAASRREALIAAVADWTGSAPQMLTTREECAGVRNGYADPARLGVDRWLAMLGARTHGEGAWLVVDAGTAMTLDAVDGAGQHLGGYIVPGYSMQVSMLVANTAGIRDAGAVPRARGFGRDTGSAISGGVLAAMLAVIQRASVELAERVDDTCRTVLTGGDAGLLAAHMATEQLVDPDLVFRGMLVELSEPR